MIAERDPGTRARGVGASLEGLVRWLVLLLPAAIVLPFGAGQEGLSVTPPDVVVVALVLTVPMLALGRQQGTQALALQPALLVPAAFVAMVAASLVASGKLFPGAVTVARMIEALVLVFVVLKAVRIARISNEQLLAALKYAGLLAALVSILQLFIQFGVIGAAQRYQGLSRSAGLAHGGSFGAIIMTGVIIAFRDMLRSSSKLQRALNGFLVLVGLGGIALTLNRTWLVCAVLGILGYLAVTNWRRLVLLSGGMLLFGAMGWWIIIEKQALAGLRRDTPALILVRFAELGYAASGELRQTSVNMRLLKWQDGLEQLRRNPVLGVGEGNLTLDVTARDPRSRTRSDSQWMDLLVKNGTVSFLLFFGMSLWLVLQSLVRAGRTGYDGDALRLFAVIYCMWMLGASFWVILAGYDMLYFAFVGCVGLHFVIVPESKTQYSPLTLRTLCGPRRPSSCPTPVERFRTPPSPCRFTNLFAIRRMSCFPVT